MATDKTSGKSKGVGYVTYSLKEDAEQAVNELDGSEFGDKGRKIRVAWANERVCHFRYSFIDSRADDSPSSKSARLLLMPLTRNLRRPRAKLGQWNLLAKETRMQFARLSSLVYRAT